MLKNLVPAAIFATALVPASYATSHEASMLRPSYICQRAETPPTIDGKLDDEVWQHAFFSAPFVDIEGARVRTPDQETRFQMAWDDTNLYIAAHISEKHIWATLKARDSIIYQDPDFEVFIDPDCDGKNYIELEINALNTVWDLFLTAPYSEPGQIALHDWDIKKLKTAVAIDGTLNDPKDEDRGWTAEIAIPWESITGHANLPRRGDAPAAGTQMRMNFSRVGWKTTADKSTTSGYRKLTDASGKNLPESNDVWSATGKINIHLPDLWGDVIFSENAAGTWEAKPTPSSTTQINEPEVHIWVHGNEENVTDADWALRMKSYKDAGVDKIIVDGTPTQVERLARYATDAGIKTIAWVWTMNQCADKEIFTPANKEWFAVSRNGKSCWAESDRPYVGYYAFLCPNQPGAIKHLKENIKKYAEIPGISAIQLDYIRMPDVILPRGLWEKYGLVQDRELPQFDFCYCELCRKKFKEKYGREVDLGNAENDARWREFRLDSIAKVANALADESRKLRIPCGAAVFPTPEIAAKLVRQDWSKFHIDFALPMDYNSFYNEPESWVGEKTIEAVKQTSARFPIFPGIHLPDVPARKLPAILNNIILNGGSGVALFSSETFSPDHAKALKEWKAQISGIFGPLQKINLAGVPNFYQIAPNLYRSAQPTAEGFVNLEKFGIKTVINLRYFHDDSDEAAGTSIKLKNVSMNAWNIDEDDVVNVMKILENKDDGPFLIHCQHGADRTGLMCAMYRMLWQNISRDAAIAEMRGDKFGFHHIWKNIPEFLETVDIQVIKKRITEPSPPRER